MRDCLIVFAKEPEAGKVKTRLQGYLSKDECVQFYKALLQDTIELARALKCSDKVLAYDANGRQPVYLKTIAGDFQLYKQQGKNLGEKMHNAFKFAKKRNNSKVAIIGSDSPSLPGSYVLEAFRRLDISDVVLGPSHDGGFYLVGLKNPCVSIFKGIKWSSKTVLEDTIKNAGTFGKKVFLLKKWYDIDDYFSLTLLKKDLKRNLKAAPWTRKLLKI